MPTLLPQTPNSDISHSKDYRADLKQLVYLLVSSEDGIPILGECYSGNAVDNFVFQQKIVQIQNLILDDLEGRALVLERIEMVEVSSLVEYVAARILEMGMVLVGFILVDRLAVRVTLVEVDLSSVVVAVGEWKVVLATGFVIKLAVG